MLPADTLLLKREWEEGGAKNKWIIKPVSSDKYSSLTCPDLRTYVCSSVLSWLLCELTGRYDIRGQG